MKCPICGKPSEIMDSRATNGLHGAKGPHMPDMIRRRRLCYNYHKFTTYEILAEVVTPLIKQWSDKVRGVTVPAPKRGNHGQ